MKKMVLLLMSVCLLTASQAFAALINAGFETGDLTGWTYKDIFGPVAAEGNASVVGTDTIVGADGQSYVIDPVEGTKMARLSYDAYLSQNSSLVFDRAGQNTLSFRYRVIETDIADDKIIPIFQNTSVVVGFDGYDSAGYKSVWGFNSFYDNVIDSGWKYYEARPRSNGDSYTMDQFGVSLCNRKRILYIDDFKINDPDHPAPVPEPSSLLLLTMGFPGLIGIKSLLKKN